jgi:hypothetical protein
MILHRDLTHMACKSKHKWRHAKSHAIFVKERGVDHVQLLANLLPASKFPMGPYITFFAITLC